MSTRIRYRSIVVLPMLLMGFSLATPLNQASAQETYSLQYKFSPEETIRWRVTQEAKVRTTIGATTQTAQTDSRSVKIWKVKEIKENGSFDDMVLVQAPRLSVQPVTERHFKEVIKLSKI